MARVLNINSTEFQYEQKENPSFYLYIYKFTRRKKKISNGGKRQRWKLSMIAKIWECLIYRDVPCFLQVRFSIGKLFCEGFFFFYLKLYWKVSPFSNQDKLLVRNKEILSQKYNVGSTRVQLERVGSGWRLTRAQPEINPRYNDLNLSWANLTVNLSQSNQTRLSIWWA